MSNDGMYSPISETNVTAKKNVLLIGLDPALGNYADFPDLDATKVLAAFKVDEDRLKSLGYDVQVCWLDRSETTEATEAVVQDLLSKKQFHCILIGAGIRTGPSHFMLFERLINVLHEHAPQAKLCFNTKPSDNVEAVLRWL
jgi:UDP-N-acetylmuramoylalanine-D-glutamate ligase